jgi:hypothetical protein
LMFLFYISHKIAAAMTDEEDLHYPHLDGCKATLTFTSGSSKPPVQLPIECRSAVHVPIPSMYDFSVGTFVAPHVCGTRVFLLSLSWCNKGSQFWFCSTICSHFIITIRHYREINHEEKGRTRVGYHCHKPQSRETSSKGKKCRVWLEQRTMGAWPCWRAMDMI